MIMELQEASQINQGLQPTNVSRTTTVVHDMKAIVKTWKLVSNMRNGGLLGMEVA